MKNKKGFTLTEILVVIVILVTVTGTTIFGIEEISKNSKEKSLKEIIKEIEIATDLYINNNDEYRLSLLNGTTNKKCTKIYVLQNEGLVSTDLINPVTNEKISSNLCVYSRVNEEGIITHEFELGSI